MGEKNIKAQLGGMEGVKKITKQQKKWMEIVVVLILKPFQFQSHL